ncbi:hypothetical protein KEM56_006553 [Ascosphaera pollenicola]|nr:hypothetical protein KEM56_006553 [Ascosphaera pollenicola]
MAGPSSPTKDDRARLDEIVTRAKAKEAMKDHETAADLFSQATELQAKINGEMCLDNAELLYMCGKSLYNLAMSRSDVFGAKMTSEIKAESPAASKSKSGGKAAAGEKTAPQNIISAALQQQKQPAAAAGGDISNETGLSATGLFQFQGDEEYDTSDEEEEETKEEEQDEPEDDFRNAWEVLDLSRVLFTKKLESIDASASADTAKQTKEFLSNVYELQAEISLEDEKFSDAVSDYKTALKLGSELYEFENQKIASCHYMLAVALEMYSAKVESDECDEAEKATLKPEDLREEAAQNMEKAIQSCTQRLAKEKARMDETKDEGKQLRLKKEITEVEELITDIKQRLSELRNPPVTEKVDDPSNVTNILSQMLGKAPAAAQKPMLEQVTKNANDLSGLVRKRKPAQNTAEQSTTKRPKEDSAGDEDSSSSEKKADTK